MKETSRPMTAYPGVHSRRGGSTTYENINRDEEPRPKSGLTVRTRVLKSNTTAFNNWLRRGNEYNSKSKKQTRDYNSVETFNLRPGCRVTKSASQLQVRVDPEEFFKAKVPKLTTTEMPVREMESLIRDLKAQVKYLTVYLEEEKLHHGGTKKRAKVDLQNAKEDMERQHGEEIEKLMQDHQEYIEELRRDNNDRVEEIQDELQRQYKTLEKEYKLLQASFRNYKGKLSEDMEEKWKNKRREFDWEKQRSVDNAVETSKKLMEERFNQERISIRSEYKQLMQEMVADQRKEMEEFMRKMSDGKLSIEELKAKADIVDQLQEELKDTKQELQAARTEFHELNLKFSETQSKLAVYENQFEEKVNEVEDKYRKRIDDLVNEVSDFRMLLIKKAETLYSERAAADQLQKRLTKFSKQRLEERIFSKPAPAHQHNEFEHETNLTRRVDIRIPIDSDRFEATSDNEPPKDPPPSKENSNLERVLSDNLQRPLSVNRKNNKVIVGTQCFQVSRKKQHIVKQEKACETEKDISVTKAGVDEIRPRLPVTTISLLDTADLPYESETEYQSQGYRLSRPTSPDVIY